jgi:hypothetical protein
MELHIILKLLLQRLGSANFYSENLYFKTEFLKSVACVVSEQEIILWGNVLNLVPKSQPRGPGFDFRVIQGR